ncbi:hypothetical protein OHR68_02560 [Spirillospora sp. NBC_00431]
MPSQRRTVYIRFADETLSDGTVHRRYDDGRQEWRKRGRDRIVEWRDGEGVTGTDELLGRRIIKRQYNDGRPPIYGRELGYGRTVWGPDGHVTLNRSSFGGRIGAVLARLGRRPAASAPSVLTPEQEAGLRRAEDARNPRRTPPPRQTGAYGGDWRDKPTDFKGDGHE